MIRNSMTRLHAEIARSIGFFRSQQGGHQPERVFLSGGSATLPYMREFFQEKFQLPVEFFNPLRNVAVGPGLNIEEIGRNAHRMGELVGLALRGTSDCPMELNLRPASVVKRHKLTEKIPFLIIAGICTLLALTLWWLYFDQAAAKTNEAADKLKPKVDALDRIDKQMKAARAEKNAQEELAGPLVLAVDERNYWVKVLEDINSKLPKDYVWITSFDMARTPPGPAVTPRPGTAPATGPGARPEAPKGPALMLKGFYLWNDRQAAVVDDFVNRLSEPNDLYVATKEESKGFKRALPNDQDWAYPFEIPLFLKLPGQASPATSTPTAKK